VIRKGRWQSQAARRRDVDGDLANRRLDDGDVLLRRPAVTPTPAINSPPSL